MLPRALVLGNECAKGTNGEARKRYSIPIHEKLMQIETPPKRKSKIQIGEHRKKMKEQKKAPQITIAEDNAKLVADKVHDEGE